MTQDLLEKPQAGQHPVLPCTHAGVILGLQGDVLHGWAMNTAQPDQRPIVEVIIDGAPVALARADQYEPLAPTGDQFHGFTVQLRQSWLDEAAVIAVRIANDSFSLEGTVVLPARAPLEVSAIASQVWHTGGLRIGGWSWDPLSPMRHVVVTVREENVVIATTTCNIHNQALAYRSTSDHGFSIDLPWRLADGKVHFLDIFDDSGNPLAGSPIRLCCWPEGAEGLLRQLDSTQAPETVALLSQVVREQTLLLPKSAGWQCYPEWFEVFQSKKASNNSKIQGSIGLLLISNGDPLAEQRSLNSSISNVTSLHSEVAKTSTDLMLAVTKLLDAGCDRIIPLHAGDRLAPQALAELSALLDDGSAWGYGDCDRDGQDGERSLPWFKPAWDIDLFIGADIFTPGAIFSAEVVQKALGLLAARTAASATGWHDLVAGIVLATENCDARVVHLPKVLYHRALDQPASPEEAEPSLSRLHAIQWLCAQLALGSQVTQLAGFPALLRAHWPLPAQLPRVSLIIPTRDQYALLKTCVEGLLEHTDYPDLELIIVDNDSTDPDTLDYLSAVEKRGVRILAHPYPFNYSTINNCAAAIATGHIIGLVNNDIEIIGSCWLREMVAQLHRPGVGAVGAKLMWPNRIVQHGGVVVGVNGLAAHTGNFSHEGDPGYLGMNQITRRQSAVTAACLVMRKSVFDEVGGLDELAFPVTFNDVDLCLRIQEHGMHIVWSAFARLIHAESASRGKDLSPEKKARSKREQRNFLERWGQYGSVDRYYHPSLSLDYLSGPYGGLTMHHSKIKPRTQLLGLHKP